MSVYRMTASTASIALFGLVGCMETSEPIGSSTSAAGERSGTFLVEGEAPRGPIAGEDGNSWRRHLDLAEGGETACDQTTADPDPTGPDCRGSSSEASGRQDARESRTLTDRIRTALRMSEVGQLLVGGQRRATWAISPIAI